MSWGITDLGFLNLFAFVLDKRKRETKENEDWLSATLGCGWVPSGHTLPPDPALTALSGPWPFLLGAAWAAGLQGEVSVPLFCPRSCFSVFKHTQFSAFVLHLPSFAPHNDTTRKVPWPPQPHG